MRKLIPILALLSSICSASDNISIPLNSGEAFVTTNDGKRWPAMVGYTTDGDGTVETIGGLVVADNVFIPLNSGAAFMVDNADRRFPATILYTTDGNGNAIPIQGAVWGHITGTLSNQTDLQNALNAKQDSLSFTAPILNTSNTVSCRTATGSLSGCLSSADWTTFNAKQPAGNYITALVGDFTASGPGSATGTLATVNSNVGSFTLGNFTVNAKGLVTAASSTTPGSITSTTNGVAFTNNTSATVGPNATINFPLARVNYTIVVDGSSTSTATQDGTWHSPYKTIQAALNAIGTPASGADAFTRWSVLIAPGAYDEALTVPSSRIITLIGLGPWTLGDAAGTNHTSTTPRSITWNCNPTDKNGKTYFPHFEITSLGEVGAISGDEIQGNTADISGNITLTTTAASAETDVEFTLNNVSVRGNIDATGVIGNVETVISNSFINGTVNLGITLTPTTAAKGRLHVLLASRITGLLTTSSYSMIANSRLSGGMTIAATVQTTPNEVGIVNSELLGVYSGAGFHLDGVSNYWFRNLSASFGSGGSATFMNDAVSTAYTPTTSADWASVPTTVQGGLDNIAGGALKRANINGGVTATNAPLVVKDGHIKSSQTTAPTTTVNANAGTGASCTVSNATDSAGTINLTTTGVASSSGVVCDVTFNKTYNVAPICVVSPSSSNAIVDAVIQGVYFTTSTTKLTANFTNTDAVGRTYNWAYNCIETQ